MCLGIQLLTAVVMMISGIQSRAVSCLLHAGFLLGLFFDHEDGGDTFLKMSVDFQQATWRYTLSMCYLHGENEMNT
jgi:hypothetical protein